jgi:hypothetical protein
VASAPIWLAAFNINSNVPTGGRFLEKVRARRDCGAHFYCSCDALAYNGVLIRRKAMTREAFVETGSVSVSEPERLLVWALRAMAIGRGDCPGLLRAFTDAYGRMGAPALHAYFVLVKSIGMTSRRRLRVHFPGCPDCSFDERAIVGVVAAALESLHHTDETVLRTRLRFLADGEPDPNTLFAARAVAQIFAASGHPLALDVRPERPGPFIDRTPPLRVVH